MTHLTVSAARWLAVPVLAYFAALGIGCGGTVFGAGSGNDAGGSGHSEGGLTVGPPCGPGESCPSGSTCFFPIGSCDAQGVCVENPPPGTAECGAIELVCGCGKEETTGCGYPGGYASGPTTGSSLDCAVAVDAGGPKPPADAGPEAGTDLGRCGANGACPLGSGCFFPIGSCGAKGECIETPPPGAPECNAIELVCGCGKEETTGCGFPGGYASGPTTGSSSGCVQAGK